jgi:hypothetical protein
VTAIEKIDPGILADVVIKATALQEKPTHPYGQAIRLSHRRDRGHGTIPPQVSFGVQRIHDLEVEEPERPSTRRSSSSRAPSTMHRRSSPTSMSRRSLIQPDRSKRRHGGTVPDHARRRRCAER